MLPIPVKYPSYQLIMKNFLFPFKLVILSRVNAFDMLFHWILGINKEIKFSGVPVLNE